MVNSKNIQVCRFSVLNALKRTVCLAFNHILQTGDVSRETSLIFGQMFWRVTSYICVEFGPMRTHKEAFGGLLELRTLKDSVW